MELHLCCIKPSSYWESTENKLCWNFNFGAVKVLVNLLIDLWLTLTQVQVQVQQKDHYCVCVFVSLLSHFRLIHFFTYTCFSTISRPLSSSMCLITPGTANVGSSYNCKRGPGIGCWFSDPSNCSHWSLTPTFTLTSENLSLYTTLLLLLVLIQLSWLQLLSPMVNQLGWGTIVRYGIPWICYERSFSEFYLSIWNQLGFNQRLQLFVQSPQPYLLVFAWRN